MLYSQCIYEWQARNWFTVASIKCNIAESGSCKTLLISARPRALVNLMRWECGLVKSLLELNQTYRAETGSNQKLSPAVPRPCDHRITQGLGLEGSLNIILFQPCCRGQGRLPLGQVAPSPIQAGLEHCQGWGSHSFCGHRGPGPQQPQSQEVLPHVQPNPSLCQREASAPGAGPPGPWKQPLCGLLLGLVQGRKGRSKGPPEKPLESTGARSGTMRAASRAWRGCRGGRAPGAEALPAGAGSSGVRPAQSRGLPQLCIPLG